MIFLGCEGQWVSQSDATTVCQGTMQTFTVQEMREQLQPALTWPQRYEITGWLLSLFVLCWVLKTIRNTV